MPPSAPRLFLARAIATGLGSGLAPFAPGTLGSAAATLIWIGSLYLCSAQPLTVAVVLLLASIVFGLPAVAEVLKTSTSQDPSQVVIDEWAGMFLIFSLCPVTSLRQILLAFILFRAFDIIKPGPISWAEKFPGAWGVMADDLVAGVLAAITLLALQYQQIV